MSLVFWLFVTGMLALAMVILLPVLLRGSREVLDTTEQQNLDLARERLEELKQEKAAGVLTDEAYQQSKLELEQRLAADLAAQAGLQVAKKQGRGLIGGLLVILPVLSILIYQYLGDLGALKMAEDSTANAMPAGHATGNGQLASVDSMVAGLAARLEQQPDDPQGWYMLARSYMSLQRYAQAARAYEYLHDLVGDDANVLVAYGDALAMMHGGRLSGKPIELIEKALAINPQHVTGLWLAGLAYREQERHAEAIASWEKAQDLLAADSGAQQELQQLIEDARRASGLEDIPGLGAPGSSAAINSGEIRVQVALAPSLLEKTAQDDTVFVLARAVSGPSMPLAVVKKQVGDLPLTITLSDAQAMAPAFKLSEFSAVTVLARISRSGNPAANPGDLEGVVSPIDPASQAEISITIDRVLP